MGETHASFLLSLVGALRHELPWQLKVLLVPGWVTEGSLFVSVRATTTRVRIWDYKNNKGLDSGKLGYKTHSTNSWDVKGLERFVRNKMHEGQRNVSMVSFVMQFMCSFLSPSVEENRKDNLFLLAVFCNLDSFVTPMTDSKQYTCTTLA